MVMMVVVEHVVMVVVEHVVMVVVEHVVGRHIVLHAVYYLNCCNCIIEYNSIIVTNYIYLTYFQWHVYIYVYIIDPS